MKILCIVMSLMMISSHALSQKEESNKVYVHTFDKDVDLSGVTDPHFVKKTGVMDEHNLMNELPSPEKQKAFIKQSGLEKELANMDQLDLDLLCASLAFLLLSATFLGGKGFVTQDTEAST